MHDAFGILRSFVAAREPSIERAPQGGQREIVMAERHEGAVVACSRS